MSRKAMEQALDALEDMEAGQPKAIDAITALRAALAEAPEPVGEVQTLGNGVAYGMLYRPLEDGTVLYTAPPRPAAAPGYCKHCKQYTIEEPLSALPG